MKNSLFVLFVSHLIDYPDESSKTEALLNFFFDKRKTLIINGKLFEFMWYQIDSNKSSNEPIDYDGSV